MEKSDYLNLYHQMVVIRRLEERAAELYQQGKIGGFLHLYIGQEAVSTGLISVRRPEDRIITAYRDHGVAINCCRAGARRSVSEPKSGHDVHVWRRRHQYRLFSRGLESFNGLETAGFVGLREQHVRYGYFSRKGIRGLRYSPKG